MSNMIELEVTTEELEMLISGLGSTIFEYQRQKVADELLDRLTLAIDDAELKEMLEPEEQEYNSDSKMESEQ